MRLQILNKNSTKQNCSVQTPSFSKLIFCTVISRFLLNTTACTAASLLCMLSVLLSVRETPFRHCYWINTDTLLKHKAATVYASSSKLTEQPSFSSSHTNKQPRYLLYKYYTRSVIYTIEAQCVKPKTTHSQNLAKGPQSKTRVM